MPPENTAIPSAKVSWFFSSEKNVVFPAFAEPPGRAVINLSEAIGPYGEASQPEPHPDNDVRGRFAALVTNEELSPANRWRLVSHLYGQRRSLIEGCVALAGVQIVCELRTGWPVFGLTGALVMAMLVCRLLLSRAFARRRKILVAHPPTAETWATRFVIGAFATAMFWALTNVLTFFFFDDTPMQMFVVMVEVGWVSAAGVRNAASPAAVMLQTWPCMIGAGGSALFGAHGFGLIVVPCAVIMASATLSIAGYLRAQAGGALYAEQNLEAANARLTQLSTTDGLTGIGNRRGFDSALQTEWSRATRDKSFLALLMIDVDSFKLFNDRYGHPAGDDCLRMVADTIAQALRRPPDFVGRFGGEEFVALLPGAGPAQAHAAAERIRAAILERQQPHAGSALGLLTVSIGIASYAPNPSGVPQTLIDLADQALYRAKQMGRNRVHPPSPEWLEEGFVAWAGVAEPAGVT